MSKLSLLTIVLTVTAVIYAGQNSWRPAKNFKAIEESVLKTHTEMVQAANNLDAEKFLAHILDCDSVRIVQDGRLFKTKQEVADVITGGFQSVDQLERQADHTSITVISPTAAVVTSTGTSTVTVGGQTFTNPFAASTLFVLADGQWKVLNGHYSVPNPR